MVHLRVDGGAKNNPEDGDEWPILFLSLFPSTETWIVGAPTANENRKRGKWIQPRRVKAISDLCLWFCSPPLLWQLRNHYTLSITPNFDTHVFAGNLEAVLRVAHSVRDITFNSDDLTIHKVEIRDSASAVIPNNHELKGDKLIIHAAGLLPEEEILVNIDFSGVMGEQLMGFYHCQYVDGLGQTQQMCATQFEAAMARKAFPCIDQPDAKAIFILQLRIPKQLTALSNMPVESVVELPETKEIEVRFQPTPPMSTYLLAWCVGQFERVSEQWGETLVSVYTTPGQIGRARYSLDLAVRTLKFLADFTRVQYPLPKMDLVAIPDFGMGAMENWGLVTFREVYLLVDPAMCSQAALRGVATVVVHELVHQWFGNLVTPFWWDNLWLNEGFAEFMSYLVIARFYPGWDAWANLVEEGQLVGLEADGLHSTHPIESCATIRMLYEAIGPDAFRDGLTAYLRDNQFSNATSDDLWRYFAKSSATDVKVRTAIIKPGYPLVSVAMLPSGPAHLRLQVRQSRFFSDGGAEEGAPLRWVVPLSVAVQWAGEPRPHHHSIRLEAEEAVMELPIPTGQSAEGLQWLLVNPRRTGFFRVRYEDPAMLARLHAPMLAKAHSREDTCLTHACALQTHPLAPPAHDSPPRSTSTTPGPVLTHSCPPHTPPTDPQQLDDADRLGLLSDTAALCTSLVLPPTCFLELLQGGMPGERGYYVWRTAIQETRSLMMLLSNARTKEPLRTEPLLARCRQLLTDLIVPALEAIGWADDASHSTSLTNVLRDLLCRTLIWLGHQPTIARAAAPFAHQMLDATDHPSLTTLATRVAEIPANLREAAFAAALCAAPDAAERRQVVDRLLEVYGSNESGIGPEEKRSALRALSSYAPTEADLVGFLTQHALPAPPAVPVPPASPAAASAGPAPSPPLGGSTAPAGTAGQPTVRTQDLTVLLITAASNGQPHAARTVWQWVLGHYAELAPRMSAFARVMALPEVIRHMSTAVVGGHPGEEVEEMRSLFIRYPDAVPTRTHDQMSEQLRINNRWLLGALPALIHWAAATPAPASAPEAPAPQAPSASS
ncbi:putative Aminopeptidase M1-D [Paratrimastix pyriformis]|uniref:Aminopeptidase M1-D n=1 Tax=Paratrimastix pyriformis TaxID=342808 RepID=A0ABQ8UFP6_9EUKA|nr:putative Aminopeptidase M1-D [Paratrimastix pyriformis]